MPLKPGFHLGPYEILSQLGAGGMGEVYKARDTRLDRIVAVKVLPAHLADKPELRERFEREAKTIANLKHPHICTLYDVGHQDGINYLVMEYLEGETLAVRLLKGPLPLDQTLRYATELGDALDTAHRQGFTHRDIKPGNIMLTPKDGSKLLDFGLAKLKQENQSRARQQAGFLDSQAPTPPPGANLTVHGTILGTPQYMAPEQLEAKEADARTDIFAFGTVVYEMATGKKAFEGQSQISLAAAILEHDPPPISTLQPMTPPLLDRVVRKCIAKHPDNRWQSAQALTDGLKWITEGGGQPLAAAPVVARGKSRERLAWGVAALALVVATLAIVTPFFRHAPSEGKPLRLSVPPPENAAFLPNSMPVLSPDGQRLAFTARDSSGKVLLWVRSLDSIQGQSLPGTEEAAYPFWSPDSRSLGYFAGGKLRKIEVSGGGPQVLADASNARGGTWSRNGMIVFAPSTNSRLFSVSTTGGQVSPVTSFDSSKGETGLRWPYFLPDGQHFLYVARNPQQGSTLNAYTGKLNSTETKRLTATESGIWYAPPGYLLYMQNGTLLAQRFDADRLELSGEPVPVAEHVITDTISQIPIFSASAGGALAYRTGGATSVQLIEYDRTGKKLGPVAEPGNYRQIALSPDEKRLAIERPQIQQGTDLWLLELSRGVLSRMAIEPGTRTDPIWSPDGRTILFESIRNGATDFYQQKLGGGAEELVLQSPDKTKYVDDWSADGKFIVYHTGFVERPVIMLLPLSGDRKPKLFLQTPFRVDEAKVSPDGRWLAYESDESGRSEIYVQPFPGGGDRVRITPNGGCQPRWRRDTKELFYLGLDGTMMAVDLKAGAALEPGVPKSLFKTGIGVTPGFDQYVVTGDGQRFIAIVATEQAPSPITLVLNWTAGLKK